MIKNLFTKNKFKLILSVTLISAMITTSSIGFCLEKKEDKKPKSPKQNPKNSITLMLTGDLMCKGAQQQAAFNGETYDFTPTFRYVKEIFKEADYVMGNLETVVSPSLPLSKDKDYMQTRPYLNAPTEWLDALKWAGYNGLILANNHATDGGKIGILDTINSVSAAGFQRVGSYLNENDPHYMIIEKKGFKIGVLAYATYFNKKEHFLNEDEQKIHLGTFTEENVTYDVQKLRDLGCKYVIAWNHLGTEYSQVPALRQHVAANIMAKAGVDYIIDSHPHVLQRSGIVKYGKKRVPIIYSMGNFTSSMSDPLTKETIILSITLAKNSKGKVKLQSHKYYPCYILEEYQGDSYVVMPESKKYNQGFKPDESVEDAFIHIKNIVRKLPEPELKPKKKENSKKDSKDKSNKNSKDKSDKQSKSKDNSNNKDSKKSENKVKSKDNE